MPCLDDAHHSLLGHTDVVEERTVGGAGEGAGTTFDAGGDVVLLATIPVLQTGVSSEEVRLETHGAGANALATTDARRSFTTTAFLLRHKEQTAGALCDRHFEGHQRTSHHGTTANDFTCICGQTTCFVDELLHGRSDASKEV